MKYWLFKTEPNTWSWEQQINRGDKGEEWDGVRNHLAQKNMREMKIGDLGFFYHSVNEKRIMGIVEIIEEFHPDHTDETGKFNLVTIKAIKGFEEPITLKQIKADETLSNMVLVKNSRLSVQPVTPEEWSYICKLSNLIDVRK